MRSFFTALLNRAYFALFCTQFLGAFNDNFFRTALAAFVTYKVTTISEESKGQIVSLAVGIFMLPYFLFSALAGELADKLRKDLLIKATKLLEVIIALMIGYGFVTSNVYFLLGVLFLMGTQSTFFGPVKYSILPDILGESQLVAGNGVIEAGTYGAILQGTILGGMIIGAGDIVIPGLGFTLPATEYRLPGIILAVACLGLTVSLFIPRRPPTNPGLVVDKNFLRSTWKNMAYAKQNQNIFLCILGISWFWMLGAVLISLIPILAEQVLKGSPSLFTFLLTLFSCGIGLGSLLCQFLVKGEITSKYVPLSAILMTVFLADLAHTISHYHVWGTMISYQEFWAMGAGKHITLDLLGFALCGGLYVVPLNAMLQFLAEGSSRSRVIAANNIINSLFMVVGCLICAVLNKQGVTLAQIFVLIAVANGLAAIYICGLLPHHIIRMILKKVFKLVYQMQVVGIENWKNLKGNVLIVANHTSFLDAVMLWTYLPEDLYFVVDTYMAQRWWVKPFLHFVKFFPVDPTNPMAIKAVIEEVKAGKRVVIFPEGRITMTGGLMKVYPGPAMIADKCDAQILPICFEGSQYSAFSRFGAQLKIRPKSKVVMTILPATRPKLDDRLEGKDRRQAAVRELYDLMASMKYQAGHFEQTIFDRLLDAYHLVGRGAEIVEDMNRVPLSFGKFLSAAFLLGKKVAAVQNQRPSAGKVAGFLLPNSAAAVATFFGMQAYGVVPAMLNFSTGVKNILACCKAAQIENIFTSHQFIEQGELQAMEQALQAAGLHLFYLEDFKAAFSWGDKLQAYGVSWAPRFFYHRICPKREVQQTAVILFTSGSEGTPKGVALTHQNIQANCTQIHSVIDFGLKDRVFNAMPIFHSFGLTVGTILPLLNGVPVFFYPSPLHYRVVPELVYDRNATIFFGTDTFFNGYAKMAHPYDFYSVRLAIVGAEKLKPETVRKYYDQFGLRILEGYGATETSPVLAVNTPMHFKRGSVGRLLPGITAKIEPVPGIPTGGKLLVQGLNVMAGYLRDTQPGVLQPVPEGWYDTGDIVEIDAEGFVFIQGRAKRFAKIAGEMISLTAVENAVNQLWPQRTNAVVSIPEEKKGEQLVLFTNNPEAQRESLAQHFREQGLSELAIPRDIRILEKIPLMGTGKVDYVQLKEMAER